jgi:hypothetical protein
MCNEGCKKGWRLCFLHYSVETKLMWMLQSYTYYLSAVMHIQELYNGTKSLHTCKQ